LRSGSIRLRLTLWYALTLAVILAASGFFAYFYLAKKLLNETDHELLTLADEIVFFQERDAVAGDPCASTRELYFRHHRDSFMRILDPAGNEICASQTFRAPLSPAARQATEKKETYFERVTLAHAEPLRLVTVPQTEAERLVRIVQVGTTLAPMEHTLANLRIFFFLFCPMALLILSLIGWSLAGRAVAPMVRMARVAGQINAEKLHLRLPVEHSGDEIALLAENCNAMLARLETSFRKLRQFSGDASHELRTPLAILRGETEVTLRWARDNEEYRSTLESNLEEINRMGRIIEDLLTLAKSDAGELSLVISELSLSDLLQEMYLQANTLGERKQISANLRLEVAEEIRLRGDALRLRQVFLNLISNSVNYTEAGGRVDIILATEGEMAVIKIADTGIGIQAEHLPNLFDRFYRIDKARNRAEGGTGLGLAISKGIVEAHGGRITVESTPGEGSTFIVHLPLQGPPGKKPQSVANG
jgi:heavy metal sensor kinase